MAQTKDGAMKVAAKKAGLSIEEYLDKVESGFKRCTCCKTWKLLDSFGTDRTRNDGKGATCFDCRRVKNPYASLRGRESTFKGKTHTEEARRKMSEAKKGKKLRLGKKHTLDTRKKISIVTRERTPRGENAFGYIDGKGVERHGVRQSDQYKRWRYDVYLRDNFTCQKCGDSSGGNLNAHHIKPFANYPELRFDVFNGITLCKSCHMSEHRS
jgi:hypothetical protein